MLFTLADAAAICCRGVAGAAGTGCLLAEALAVALDVDGTAFFAATVLLSPKVTRSSLRVSSASSLLAAFVLLLLVFVVVAVCCVRVPLLRGAAGAGISGAFVVSQDETRPWSFSDSKDIRKRKS